MGRMYELYKVLSMLRQRDAQILSLYDEGLTPASIAGILNIPLTLVYEVIEDRADPDTMDMQYNEDEM